MNFLDAIRSARPLRRRGKESWIKQNCHDWSATYTAGQSWMDPEWLLSNLQLSAEDILADDWEAMPREVTVSPNILWRAWQKSQPAVAVANYKALARALGLED